MQGSSRLLSLRLDSGTGPEGLDGVSRTATSVRVRPYPRRTPVSVECVGLGPGSNTVHQVPDEEDRHPRRGAGVTPPPYTQWSSGTTDGRGAPRVLRHGHLSSAPLGSSSRPSYTSG